MLPLVVSIISLWLVFSVIDLQKMLDAITRISLLTFILSVVLVAIYFMAGALRFAWLLKPFMNISLGETTKLNFLSILSAHAFGIISEALRIGYLVKMKNMTMGDSIAANIADRMLSLWFLVLVLTCLTPLVIILPFVVVSCIAVFCVLIISIFSMHAKFWPSYAAKTFSFLTPIFISPSVFFKQALCSFIGIASIAVALSFMAITIGITFTPLEALLIASIALFASILPFTYAGLGAREAAMAFVLPFINGASAENAIALSILLGACYFFASLPAIFMWPMLSSWKNQVV